MVNGTSLHLVVDSAESSVSVTLTLNTETLEALWNEKLEFRPSDILVSHLLFN